MLPGKLSDLVNEDVRAILRGMSLLKIVLGVGVLALSSCSSINIGLAKVRGRADARKDVQNGKLRVEFMGLPDEKWVEIYEDLLWKRYRIDRVMVAGCVVSDNIFGHAKGYNEVMQAEIDRRFGADVLKKTAEEARKKAPPP